jgi:hypothetical protein
MFLSTLSRFVSNAAGIFRTCLNRNVIETIWVFALLSAFQLNTHETISMYTSLSSHLCFGLKAMSKNKEILKAALNPLKNKHSSNKFLTTDSIGSVDVLFMADLRPAFEKVRSD